MSMKVKAALQTALLGSDREKPVPKSVSGRLVYYIRYYYPMLLGLNLLFIVCCIPVVTIPGAWCAMTYVLTKLVRGEVISLWSDFFREFKADFFKRVFTWSLLVIAPFSLAFYTVWMGLDYDGTVTRGICFLVLFCLQSYWFCCMALISAPVGKNLKNAAILMAAEWKRTLALLLSAGVLMAACFLFPMYGLPVAVLCLFSVCQLIVCLYLTQPILDRLGAGPAQCA